jgi:hypothetical protein
MRTEGENNDDKKHKYKGWERNIVERWGGDNDKKGIQERAKGVRVKI